MNLEDLRIACLAKIKENADFESQVNEIFEIALEAIEEGNSVENEVELGFTALNNLT